MGVVDSYAQKVESWIKIAPFSNFINKSNTIRVYVRPSSGSNGYFRLELNGTVIWVQGGVYTTPYPGEDYVKFGLYDYNRMIVDPAQPARGRRFTVVTESFRIYEIPSM